MKYTKHYSKIATPQSEPIPGSAQVKNSAGGYSFEVGDWQRFDRFLILGTEGGSYYASEKKLTVDNAKHCQALIDLHGVEAVKRIVEVSDAGRAAKNDPAIFLLAMAAASNNAETKRAAFAALPKVCRTGTHLFHFSEYVKNFRGWGRGLCSAIGSWYNRDASDVALQATKYQSRDGWTHRDLLRKGHPCPETLAHKALFHWITTGNIPTKDSSSYESFLKRIGNDNPAGIDALFAKGGELQIVGAYEKAKTASVKDLVKLITQYRLPRECIPTEHLNNAQVWEALLENMPLTAMIRNLGKMSAVGLLTPNSNAASKVISTLRNRDYLHKSRVHPIAVLAALKTYSGGHGFRGSLTWGTVQTVVDALDDAFYAAFENVEPTNKKWVLGLDVSGSMTCGEISGVAGLTPRVASAALAMVTARTEKDYCMMAFCDHFVELKISARQRLDDVCKMMDRLSFGGTDCSLPMVWALKNKIPADVFAVYTDSETWAGKIHPPQALQQYRKAMTPDARLVVVGMVANEFSIADPNDPGMIDIIGFSTDTPQIISQFASGKI